jgi:SepF-like predicted cell division protein (DUF552 family)
MEDEESMRADNLPVGPPSSRAIAYMLLKRQSKKLGVVATKAFGDFKQFLNYEIHLPPVSGQIITAPTSRHRGLDDENFQKVIALKKTVEKSHEVLASIQTVALFPDRIIVDRTKITIVKRNFFWSADVISIQVEDILNVASSVGPFFGSITIASRVMSTTDHFRIDFLWRSDAIDLKHIIQGYVIAKQSGIDIDQLERREILETLRELGHDSGM